MKFKCEKEDLLTAVAAVSRLATARATLPILQNIYLEVGKDGLIARATDLEQTLEAKAASEVEVAGKITVPARMLGEYLQNNSDHNLTVSCDDTSLEIISANHRATFKGMPAEDYPTLPKATTEATISLPGEAISAAVTKTIFAAAQDDSRPALGGMLWRFKEDSLELVATDGYRLAHHTVSVPGKITGDYIIPRRSLQELVRLTGSEEVEVIFAGTQVKFKTKRLELTSRILEGKFPDYAAILPKKKTLAVTVATAALLQSLKLTSLFSRDSAYSTKLELEEAKLRLKATSAQLGENSNEITLEKPVAAKFAISLNAQYLIEALPHFGSDVSLEFVDDKSPIVLRPGSKEGYLYLVMPLRQ
jgi:DNA polymerase III subunit beta